MQMDRFQPGRCTTHPPPQKRRDWTRDYWDSVAWVLIAVLLLGASSSWGETTSTKPFVVFLVSATHLDYENPARLFGQLQKRSTYKSGYMGHSWVYLQGWKDGRPEVTEAGITPDVSSGLEFVRAVQNLSRYGYTYPTERDKQSPRFEPNPVAYLWKDHHNGYLQPTSGKNQTPTYAARVDLSPAQYQVIRALMNPSRPSHKNFNLTGQQCTSFMADIASAAGIRLEHQVTIQIPSQIRLGGETYRLWTSPIYSRLTLSVPDMAEKSLKRLVMEGRATDVLDWYMNNL